MLGGRNRIATGLEQNRPDIFFTAADNRGQCTERCCDSFGDQSDYGLPD